MFGKLAASCAISVMDVTKEQMAGAKGFDENNWPNFSSGNFASELQRRYKIEVFGNRDNNRDGVPLGSPQSEATTVSEYADLDG